MENCIFCGKKNDGSDEHIIPNCINGKLHSKKLICYDCNSNKFGANIDKVIKELFGPLMTIWGLKNGSGFHLETPEGAKYLMTKEGKTQKVKPELDIIKGNGKTEIRVTGDKKNAVKLFKKKKEELLKKGYKEITISQAESTECHSPLFSKWKLDSSPELILLLNKIATEYYAYCGLNIEAISDLTSKVNLLDDTLDNVVFCNFEEDVREFESKEITHLITLQNDTKSNVLYAYIELFNVICVLIPLVKNYKGGNVNYSYKQDVVTGQKIKGEIDLNEKVSKLLNNDENENELRFGLLVNKLTNRVREAEFEKIYKAELNEIKKELDREVSAGKIAQDKFVDEYIKRSTKMIAQLALFDFPYMVEDFKDEENDSVNYIHSNLREENFDEFCKVNSGIIGQEIQFLNEGVFIFDSYFKQPFLERNGTVLVTVFCVLAEKSTGKKRYIPYRYFFEGIKVEENKS